MIAPQRKEAFFGGLKLLFQGVEPLRMNTVAGTHDLQPLQLGPEREVLEVQLLAGSSRVLGVNMDIGVVVHGSRDPDGIAVK